MIPRRGARQLVANLLKEQLSINHLDYIRSFHELKDRPRTVRPIRFVEFIREVSEAIGAPGPLTPYRRRVIHTLNELGATKGLKRTTDLSPVMVARWLHHDGNDRRGDASWLGMLEIFEIICRYAIIKKYILNDPFDWRAPAKWNAKWRREYWPYPNPRHLEELDREQWRLSQRQAVETVDGIPLPSWLFNAGEIPRLWGTKQAPIRDKPRSDLLTLIRIGKSNGLSKADMDKACDSTGWRKSFDELRASGDWRRAILYPQDIRGRRLLYRFALDALIL